MPGPALISPRPYERAVAKSLARMNAHYAVQKDEGPLRMFQRFNLSGCDYKGQVSTGFGVAGFSFRLKAGFSLGTLFAGRLKLDAMAGGEGTYTCHTVMVCARFPLQAHDHARDVAVRAPALPAVAPAVAQAPVSPPQGGRPVAAVPLPAAGSPGMPLWQCTRPLALGMLTGVVWEGAVLADATAAIGKVDLGEVDAAGYRGKTSGVKLTAALTFTYRHVSLVDNTVRTFGGSAYDDGLARAVDVELVGDVKLKVLAWLKELQEKPPVELAALTVDKKKWSPADYGAVDGKGGAAGATKGKDEEDDDDEDDDEDEDEDKDEDKDKDKGAKSDQDQSDVDKLKTTGKDIAAKLKKPVAWAKKIHAAFKGWPRPGTEKVVARLREQRKVIADDPDPGSAGTVARVDEFIEQLEALKHHKDLAKASVKSAKVAPAPAPAASTAMPGLPETVVPSRLQMSTKSSALDSAAVAGADLSFLSKKWEVKAEAKAAGLAKWTWCRFQMVGEHTGAGALVMTQETWITHLLLTFDAEGAVGEKSRAAHKGYGTITYKSVVAYWLAGGAAPAATLPNGSGVSFGLSVAADRLAAYALWCRGDRGAELPEAVKKTETLLTGQLRVDTGPLRDFFADYDFDAGDIGRALLVESSFALRQPAPLLMTQVDGKDDGPADLFEHAPAKRRLDQEGADEVAGVPLQALRVRCPLGSETDDSCTMFSFGVVFFKVRGRKLSRVGSQGAFDLLARFYPAPAAAAAGDTTAPDLRDAAGLHELAVPPVVLFGETE